MRNAGPISLARSDQRAHQAASPFRHARSGWRGLLYETYGLAEVAVVINPRERQLLTGGDEGNRSLQRALQALLTGASYLVRPYFLACPRWTTVGTDQWTRPVTCLPVRVFRRQHTGRRAASGPEPCSAASNRPTALSPRMGGDRRGRRRLQDPSWMRLVARHAMAIMGPFRLPATMTGSTEHP